MSEAARYDVIGDFYLDFVARGLASEETLFYQLTAHLLGLLPPLLGLDVLDLACGEGHLSRQLAAARGSTLLSRRPLVGQWRPFRRH